MSNQPKEISVGLKGQKSTVATEAMSAQAMGSGSVANTFSTPAMLVLMEGAAVAAIENLLPADSASVGISASISHLAATPIGNIVRAEAIVTAVSGRRISLDITVHDEHELIGQGGHERVIIKRSRFAERLAAKQSSVHKTALMSSSAAPV